MPEAFSWFRKIKGQKKGQRRYHVCSMKSKIAADKSIKKLSSLQCSECDVSHHASLCKQKCDLAYKHGKI